MKRFQTYILLSLTLAAMLTIGSAAQAQESKGVQFWGRWQRYPNKPGVWFCPYFFKAKDAAQFSHLYVIWYKDSEYCYCYNPRKKKYWGRWHHRDPRKANSWEFQLAVAAKEGSRPSQVEFAKEHSTPSIGKTGVVMQAPPDLPEQVVEAAKEQE